MVFTVLATEIVARSRPRSVVGMLADAEIAKQISFHAACQFFSAAVCEIDLLCLTAAQLIVAQLLSPYEPVIVVVDDTLFKR